MSSIQPIPKIDKNAPLVMDKKSPEKEESHIEKQGKLIFVFGVVFSALIFIATWVVFWLWVK